jgi:hypothetical protein
MNDIVVAPKVFTNVLTLDEHVNRINQCWEDVKNSIFAFVDAIKLAFDQWQGDFRE